MSKEIIAIDLGGTSAKLALISEVGEIKDTWSVATDSSDQGQQIVPNLIESIQRYIADKGIDSSDLKGIGMGTPGTVDVEAKTVKGAYNLGWAETQLIGQAFEAAFACPFYLDNDANVAALGEQWQGAGKSVSDIVMITLGTGVGGGVVINGRLHHGVGAAGEVGHMMVDFEHGFDCTCGKKGCLESVASATGIVHLYTYHAPLYQGESSLLEEVLVGSDVSSQLIFSHAEAGDDFAKELVDRFADYLGIACANIAMTINPALIVLGGGVSAAGDFLLDQVNKYYQVYTYPPILELTQLALASLGNQAGILGAGHLVNLYAEE